MLYLKQLVEEENQIKSLHNLTLSYGEIAAKRMMRIREKVLKNREFLQRIEGIFKDCLSSFASRLSKMVAEGKISQGGKVTFLAHNGKTVGVFLSANTGFFGDIVGRSFERFIKDWRELKFEVTIIGKLGKKFFLDVAPEAAFTFFEFPDFGVDKFSFAEAIKHLVQYEEIRLYFGRFVSVVKQEVATMTISAGTPVPGKLIEPEVRYIFEPSLEEILMFFETQIFASLFDQANRESQLAKYASRILAMDKANVNIEKRLKAIKIERLKLTHSVENRKQTEILASLF